MLVDNRVDVGLTGSTISTRLKDQVNNDRMVVNTLLRRPGNIHGFALVGKVRALLKHKMSPPFLA